MRLRTGIMIKPKMECDTDGKKRVRPSINRVIITLWTMANVIRRA
jgi:hypothetical protein